VPLPPVAPDGERFFAVSWSPDGKWLAGVTERQDSRSLPGIVLYSPASKSYQRVTTRGEVPRWMPDGKTLLVLEEGRIVAVDVLTRKVRELLAPPPSSRFLTHCVSPDGGGLFVSRLIEEGDIGMLALQ
jgi:hypothetical protein